jgi:CBS domain-containing protein
LVCQLEGDQKQGRGDTNEIAEEAPGYRYRSRPGGKGCVAPARHIPSVTVEEVMSRNPVTCNADDDLQGAVDTMEKHQVRRIPVVDDHNRIIGIISQADIATRA